MNRADECGQVPVTLDRVDMRMVVRVLSGPVSVEMPMTSVVRWGMNVQSARGEMRPDTDTDEHDSNAQFGPTHYPFWQRYAGQHEQTSDNKHDDGVAKPPPDAERYGWSDSRAGADKRGHGDHMIDLECVRSTKRERGRTGHPDICHIPVPERMLHV
jgi:hypothetical protein